MIERELKLYIPPAQQQHVAKALACYKKTQTIHLAAQYFDTPQRCLARGLAALRLRLEEGQWVQTLKMRGKDELSNVEFNHLRPNATLDLNVYENTVAAPLLDRLNGPLELRYETEVQRQVALVQSGSSKIEIALDIGLIRAKNSELPISEIEFELKKGAIHDVFVLAAQWLEKYSLIIELRSKSERGDTLYEHTCPAQPVYGHEAGLAIASQPFRIPKTNQTQESNLAALYFKSNSKFLSQVIRNAAYLAGVDETQAPSELHASYLTLMRVGMRRLRSCRQLFKPWLRQKEMRLAKQLRRFYKQFGLWRDKDMLWLEMQPKLLEAGLPRAQKLEQTDHSRLAIQDLAKNHLFQLCLLENLAQLVQHKSLRKPAYKASAAAKLQYRLHRSLQLIQRQAREFISLSPKKQHDLRNEIKRLRYNLEALCCAEHLPLYQALAKAQDHLGDLCDAYVALEWYSQNAINKHQKIFAQDWLDKKIAIYTEKTLKTLRRLQEQTPPTIHIDT